MELEPCPVCGATKGLYILEDHHEFEWYVFCDNCKTFLGNEYAQTKEDAIKHWNNRVSRACYADEVTNRNCKYSVNRGWCENTCKVKMGNCSKCNHGINDKAYFVKVEFDDGCYTYESRAANYCPNCGAKILKE